MGTSWVAVSINNIKARVSREMVMLGYVISFISNLSLVYM